MTDAWTARRVRERVHRGVYLTIQRLRRRPISRILGTLAEWERLDRSGYKRLCRDRLREALAYAKAHVPLYAGGDWSGASADPRALASWPVLERPFVERRLADLASRPAPAGVVYRRSSASTRHPLRVPWDPAATAWGWAGEHRAMLWHGVPIGVETVMLWGREEPLVNRILNRRFFSTRNMTAAHMDDAARCILKRRPALMYAMPSAAQQLARFIGVNYPRAPRPLVGFAKVGGEQVFPFQREEVRRYLGARLVQFYGCAEVGAIAAECPRGSLHIMGAQTHVEVLRNDEPAEPGELGDLVLTSLVNRAMPLVRYRNGDRARLSAEPCACGLPHPVIAELQSRKDDVLLASDGSEVHGSAIGHALHASIGRPPLGAVRQVLFEQIDHRTWRVQAEVGGESPGLRGQVEELVRSLFGNECRVHLSCVAFIPREASGKYRYYRGQGRAAADMAARQHTEPLKV